MTKNPSTDPHENKPRGARRVSLARHRADIVRWVEEGHPDVWIAAALGTTASSVQSFRSRHGIFRRPPQPPLQKGPTAVFEGSIEHRAPPSVWFDPAVADDVLYNVPWAKRKAVQVTVSPNHITITPR